MGTAGLLPRRWRQDEAAARHLEAIAHVLDTPPLKPSADGPVICAQLGTAQVLPLLVAAKSLHHRLQRGRFVLVTDSSLTGADRTVLAYHLGDPEMIADTPRELPAGLPWGAIMAAAARRRGEYCLVLSVEAVVTGDLPQVAQAIAANRSLATTALPGALIGFAAGGPPPPEPRRFVAALGDDFSPQAQLALLLAREIAPAELGRELAIDATGGPALTAASCAAIAAFG